LLAIGLLASTLSAQGLHAASATDGTLEKMIVANGRVVLQLDQKLLGAKPDGARVRPSTLRFDIERDSFLTVLVFNGELRGPQPGTMRILPLDAPAGPERLAAAFKSLVVEQTAWGGDYELVVRDGSSGYTFFNIEGQELAYRATDRALNVSGGRLLVAPEFAKELGVRAGTVVGAISVQATLRPIEVSTIANGEIQSDVMPGREGDAGTVPGPDVIVGDLNGLAQFGTTGTQVGLAVGTDSCNAGVVDLNWFALPSNDHPVIPQNMYRMSGGTTNDERFEQIGQSQVKHAFTALTQNLCSFGCNGVGGTHLGSGCSDPYVASLNAGPSLGSRAWINPFTGVYPRGDSGTPPNDHAGHTHPNGAALHRILIEVADLNTTLNAGATYFAEAQYVTPHEYVWCQANPTQCNMYNNVSYRRYNVSGTTSFSFSPAAATVRMQPAIAAWTGSSRVEVRPEPGVDGIAFIAYKVTNPAPNVWHYEYALYNQNLDRGIQSFAIPKFPDATLSNVGFHAPPQHPAGWTGDGTGGVGYSSAAWTQQDIGGRVTWSSETFAQNQNANAVRWGTMYNIRFDSNRPPMKGVATVGFFKTGDPVKVIVDVPSTASSTCGRGGCQ
jgi:hypothetical protein